MNFSFCFFLILLCSSESELVVLSCECGLWCIGSSNTLITEQHSFPFFLAQWLELHQFSHTLLATYYAADHVLLGTRRQHSCSDEVVIRYGSY